MGIVSLSRMYRAMGVHNVKCVGVILAAGGGRRMGGPKALRTLEGGQTLLEAHVNALSKRCDRIVVVVGASADQVQACLPSEVEVVVNDRWAVTEPRDSLRMALGGLDAGTVAVVTPVDCPPVPEFTLSHLLAHPAPCVPVYEGQRGHPVVLDAARTCRQLHQKTLHEVLSASETTLVSVKWPGTLLNLNTPEDWARWCSDQGSC